MIDVNERNIPIAAVLPDNISIIEMAALRRSLILGIGSIANNQEQWNRDLRTGVLVMRFLAYCIEKLNERFEEASFELQQRAIDIGEIDLAEIEIDTEVQ